MSIRSSITPAKQANEDQNEQHSAQKAAPPRDKTDESRARHLSAVRAQGRCAPVRINKELRCKTSPHLPPPYHRPVLSCADHEGEYIGGPKLTFDLMGRRLYISGQPSSPIRTRLSPPSEPLQSAWTLRGSLATPTHCNRTEFETTARTRLVRKSQAILQLTPADGRDCRRNE